MIYIITHKKFNESLIDSDFYRILHVGTNDNYEQYYLRDNTGDNISERNPWFCELTGLYWVWKNIKDDDGITGLVHYRRYFTTKEEYLAYAKNGVLPSILKEEAFTNVVNKNTIILPSAYKTLSTLYNSYKRCHEISDLKLAREVLNTMTPEYVDTFDAVLNQHKGYYYNMFISTKEVLNAYCEWLFPILFMLEGELQHKKDDDYQKRVYGFISERLLQVWVKKQRLNIVEMPVFNSEQRPLTLAQRNKNRLNYIVDKALGLYRASKE